MRIIQWRMTPPVPPTRTQTRTMGKTQPHACLYQLPGCHSLATFVAVRGTLRLSLLMAGTDIMRRLDMLKCSWPRMTSWHCRRLIVSEEGPG
jgi:hypothetical protein